MALIASPGMNAYFDELNAQTKQVYEIAQQARAKRLDPAPDVEVKLAKNMAERVVGLISVLAPQIVDSGVVERIIELEKQYGSLDWRVAFKIAEEVAQEKFCKFKDQHEAVDIGIRTGFAYVTVGVVSSPLDGIVTTEFKDRIDKRGKYISISFAGPIRNAGGTAAAVSVLIADHVRKKLGFDVFDATEQEIKRAITELQDYHDRVTNLQYFPYPEEVEYLMKRLPVEVAGEPSEKIEVSNHKDLPRIPTNMIRSGYCLVLSSCIPLKAPKLWAKLSKWGKEFDMEHWNFLEEYIKLQKTLKSKGGGEVKKEAPSKIMPDYTYITDLVAGRPILGHPLRPGGFRLRYGRSRASGLSGQCIHPATMHVLDDYIATGTQLKVERPGKGAAFTPCDTIEGPVVKLDDGSVVRLETEAQALQVKKRVAEILFLGDALIDYGDFANRNHVLAPAGYCEEWWALDVKKHLETIGGDFGAIAAESGILPEKIQAWLADPHHARPTSAEAVQLSRQTQTPLHPAYTYFWHDLDRAQFMQLIDWLAKATLHVQDAFVHKIVLPLQHPGKRSLELLGVPHIVVNKEFVVIEPGNAPAFAAQLGITDKIDLDVIKHAFGDAPDANPLVVVQKLSLVPVRDKSGTYIGSRMGRPEKAKQRKLTGSPHGLFPVGEEGGKLRSFQTALKGGKIVADFPLYRCPSCVGRELFATCTQCGQPTIKEYFCKFCSKVIPEATCAQHGKALQWQKQELDIKRVFTAALRLLEMETYPDLIKGVRGTSNEYHHIENLAKAVLRAKHDLYVNKDGTVRYDCSELTLTHFRPSEIRVSASRLRELGYTQDIHGKPLERDDQILEIKPQDVVLPSCPVGPDEDEPADVVMFRTAQFIDDLLVKVYKLPPFYRLRTPDDLVGHCIVGLAPHTSAGMLGRIIGFSKTQGFLAHPYYHQACRRDCDGDEIGFMMLMDGFLNFSKQFLPGTRGSTMDAPLVLSSTLIPTEVDDQAFDVGIAWSYPIALYESALQYKMPGEVKIQQIKHTLNTPAQYEGMGFTHDMTDLNAGVLCSAYKTLPSMEEKLRGQMILAEKIRAVDTADVAHLVIEKHFLRDLKGNLRKFGMQEFRCVNCNEKFRRPPLIGKCTECSGKLLFTITEGSVVKYLGPTISLVEKYHLSEYMRQTVEILQRRIEGLFGRDPEKQMGLGQWFG
ncbi:DNA polymerase II large subunit [Candidatus Woesearchaeota archaeon]|nr:DNA polymerase II large subunit [Candidatus Woesearchaeota archaeon]